MGDSTDLLVFEHGEENSGLHDPNILSGKYSALNSDEHSSDDDQPTLKHTKKSKHRLKGLSDDSDQESAPSDNRGTSISNLQDDSDSEPTVPQREPTKSRLRLGDSSDSDNEIPKAVKNEEQQERMKNKRDKIKQKFNRLLSSRGKQTHSNNETKSSDSDHNDKSGPSDNEMSSIATIKQKIKKSMTSMASICDPDTSDEEGNIKQVKQKVKKPRSAKVIEAKPLRMSAKQAMENMQMIKSESNRMLREKEVSLPYHRPKALSLKDIMARRRPALASDGKALPIKMNEEQLKQYALSLEERQKEMMELCKSDTDNEEDPENEGETKDNTETNENIEQNHNSTVADSKEPENKVETNDITETEVNIEPKDNTMEVDYEIVNTNNDVTKIDTENNINTNLVNNPDENIAINDPEIANNVSPNVEAKTTESEITDNNILDSSDIKEQNNSNTDMQLVYNSSIEEDNVKDTEIPKETIDQPVNTQENSETTKVSEADSQLMLLHYTEKDTENSENPEKSENSKEVEISTSPKNDDEPTIDQPDFFSDDDDDVNMEDIDRIIENAEIISENNTDVNSPLLIRDQPYKAKPKLMGAPGMVIDLDGTDPIAKKLSGVELLKERFAYFARLKTAEELEKAKEKRLKPGSLHLKLKHELEEQIAEQRSLEWAKRLEEEKQQQNEIDTILDDDSEYIEKDTCAEKDETTEKEKTADEEGQEEESSSEEEEELIENDVDMIEKPKKRNPMLDDEAEESEHEDDDNADGEDNDNEEACEESNEESSEEESSDDELEVTTNKKGRILKAFEDSDEEDNTPNKDDNNEATETCAKISDSQTTSQDDEIQLAQRLKSASDDLFTSQETTATKEDNVIDDVSTQTFSILETKVDTMLDSQEDMSSTQPYHDPKLDAVVDNLSQNLLTSQASQYQGIGDDVLALCTGKFFDNQFVSPEENNVEITQNSQDSLNDLDQDTSKEEVVTQITLENLKDPISVLDKITLEEEELKEGPVDKEVQSKIDATDNNLKSILDELDDPKFDQPKPNKFFTGGNSHDNTKKKFIIDSDDEGNEESVGKKKKFKKKKAEKRALQISDDEEEEEKQDIENDEMSDLEDDTVKLVEYDSEENEIIVQPDLPKKKKRKTTEFFEQEAELTSEDEWIGSGDEDERGLDRMEREEGDDDVFHQGQLRNELGQIHMRDVLDQDKREVRLLQELLFEDGDLGGGHRQRKFRWRNTDDGEEELPTDLTDTQEEEFESEEQWRKQRHEREVFLRQLQNEENQEDSLNVSINRTSIIKANLSSKSMSMLLEESKPNNDVTDTVTTEKKTTKDIPSPKKSFAIFQQSYHSSLLTRGRGALARLAALATPLAADDDAPKIGSLAPHKRNFVFAALTPEPKDVKTTKRKAEVSVGTPKLMKKMKIEEQQKRAKNSLLDHLNT